MNLSVVSNFLDQIIEVVEVIEPKENEDALSGWEHVEFLDTPVLISAK